MRPIFVRRGRTSDLKNSTLQTALSSDATVHAIGTPLDTVSCFVLKPCTLVPGDSSFKLMPRGEIGELAVGGHQLARGYLNRPEQTASAFISSPYGRLYRTGDAARVTADGKLECLGRLAGGQVKLRGQRIELGEVEQAALSMPGCRGTVAAVIESSLVVFCAVDPDVTEDDVLMHCKRWLPLFMVPGQVIALPEFPRLPSGKVDVVGLKATYQAQNLADAGDGTGLAVEEEEISQVVSLTLGLQVSRQMTLASAGVDSLSAIRLASALRLSGLETTAPELLKLRTIADIFASVGKRPLLRSDPELLSVSLMADLDLVVAQNPDLKLDKALIEDVLPCTPLQSAMLAETARDPCLYSNEMKLRAPGLAPTDIIDAIRRVAQSNEILRTGFASRDGVYFAIVFKSFSESGLQIVGKFQRGLVFAQPQDFLIPLRFQVRADARGAGLSLLIQAHHAAYDGWSMDMLLSDLSALLRRLPLAPRPQFRELLYYHARDRKKEADGARRFWSEHLLGWNKSMFPRLTSRNSMQNEIKTRRQTLTVPPSQIRDMAQYTGLSIQVPFQAALALLWSGVTGEDDLVLGSVTSGRTIPVDRIEEVMGPCIASLPLRVSLSRVATYADLMRSIQASNRAIMEHCGLPLSEIKTLTELQPAESLYDVLFAYQDSLEGRKGSWLFTEVEHLDRLESRLLIEIQPAKPGFIVQATYHASWFPQDFVEGLVQQFDAIVATLLRDPGSRIQMELASVMPGQSIHRGASQSFSGIPDLAAQFEAAAAKMPSATALCFRTSTAGTTPTTSYKELDEASNQVAHYLDSCQVAIGEIVAIMMQKSPIFYTSVLGIVKAGCAYLPIIPSAPKARIQEILKQAQVKHCLVDNASSIVPFEQVRFHEMDSIALRSYSKKRRGVPADPSRLAYVVYTSGTTGNPKGVAVTQKNIVSNIATLHSTYPSAKSAQPRLLQACSQAFDVSVFEIFFAWYAGMALCASTNDVMFEDLESSIRELGITHLSLAPTVASLVRPEKVPAVEFLVTAGEPMTLSVLDKWDDRLWQGYGPSETTNICSVKRMKRGDVIEHLGWALPNTSTFVLRPSSLEMVPIGWVGEFCFGGDQVAMGYLNDTRLTSEKFIYHPKFGRIYRSGDVGRMLPDGSLVIIGRLDGQIKLRGQRIETSEINSVLTSTGRAVAAVTIIRSKGTSEQLVSYFVPPGAESEFGALEIDREANHELFASLSSRVPPYMVPSYLVPVSQIPVGSSGKVDWRRLETSFENLGREYLEAAASTHTQDDETDWTSRETMIAEALAQSTKASRADIKRWTPFAALGVDSISAIHVSRVLHSQLGTRFPISAILQNPTVVQLAKYDEVNGRQPGLKPVDDAFLIAFASEVGASLQGLDAEGIFPCTPIQEGMILQGKRSYCTRILLRLRVQAQDLMAYWDRVSERHGILRTCFVTTRRTTHPIAQVVLRGWKVSWRSFDVDEPSLAGAVKEHLESLPEPLDSGTPPISCALIRHRGETLFSLICHHAMYDGVGMETLWREIEALAKGHTLPPLVSYEPFIERVISRPEDADAFWTEQLRDFRPQFLCIRRTDADIHQCTLSMSLGGLGHVQERLRGLGVSLLSACQTAWATVISMACDCQDVVFGNVVSGRIVDVEGVDRLVAPCFNTIPLRVNLSRSSQYIELARHLQSLNAQMLPYQFTSLRRVQRLATCQSMALFDTLLLLQQPPKDMDESVWTLEEIAGDMDIPVVCELVPCPSLDSIVVNIHHDKCVINGDVATALADMFKFVLRRLVEMPFASPYTRSALPKALQAVLVDVAPTPVELARGDDAQDESWNDTEMSIRQILSELSGVSEERISRHTTIFRLGLDSINAVQVASMLKQKGFSLSASDVIQYANCAKLAPRLVHGRASGGTILDMSGYAGEVSWQISCPFDVEGVLPATPMQAAMLAAFIQSQGHSYLNMLTYHVRGAHVDDVVRAWDVLHRRHPMLRTGFAAVRHSESPFAMVRLACIEAPVEIGAEESLDLSKWQHDSRCLFLKHPHLPPWRVMLTSSGDEVVMHLAIHHALHDAFSLAEMLRGLSCLIENAGEPTFPAVESVLGEVLARGRVGQDAEDFWKSLSDKCVVNKFPILTPLREEAAGLTTHEAVSSMPLRGLCEVTRRCGVSIQAAVQAAWARVLAEYLGEGSVVFGVVLSGRTTDATQAAPFPCITTVPVVASIVSSNKEQLGGMMTYNSELHKHQFSPLSQVQKWLGHEAPVFDTLIVYHGRGTEPEKLVLVRDEPAVDYAVSLEIEPQEDRVRLRLTFDRSVLPKEQACLVVEQFDSMLQHLVCEPDGGGLYPERPHLFAVTPASSPVLPAPVELLHEFVEQRSVMDPGLTALEFSNLHDAATTWTYQELNSMGNKVAGVLREAIQAGDIVAIHFQKCPEAYFSILGILKAGCAFVALDPSAPRARNEFILRDSGAKCLVTDRNSPEFPASMIRIDRETLKGYPEQGDFKAITPQHTCYCLYTSGTTGTPKGCEISHENAVQAMMAFQGLFRGHWDGDSRWLQFAALHFDVSVLEQYWSWSVGITVVAAPRDLILDDLVGAINRLGITHIDLTPSLARLTHPDEVLSLCRGVFITGGEQLRQDILDNWGPKGVIYNAYGPTEATIGVTMYQRVPVNGRPGNIGRQFPNVGTYVLHPGTETPVLRGAVGELCVSGKLVGKGYLNRPGLTRERFPRLGLGERVYRTGDLVRILHDGCFEFVGRADDQIKLRGQRLETGEIDHAIRTGVPGVRNVATLLLRRSGRDVLVSFVVGQPTHQSLCVLEDPDGLGAKAKAVCVERMPPYMVPTYYLRLPYVPLSPNNKVEAKELRALFEQLSHEQRVGAAAAPRDAPDKAVLDEVIRAVSECSSAPVGSVVATTSILDLVDSITVLHLSTLLRSRGFRAASPATLLRHPVIADLVGALSGAAEPRARMREARQAMQACHHRHVALVCRELGVRRDEVEYVAPCSPLQEGILFRAQEPHGAYFAQFELRLGGAPLDRVRRAWTRLVGSHAILRSVFVNTPDGCVQAALKQKTVWREVHVEADDGAVAVERQRWIEANRHRVVDPFEIVVVQGPRSQRVLMHLFHALYDGHSLELMNQYASALYHNETPTPGPPFVEALAFGPLQRHDHCRPFWTQHLRGWAPTPLALTAGERPAAASRLLSLSRLEELRSAQNVTMQSVVLALWAAVLRRHLGGKTIGVVVAGRAMDLDVPRTIGPLFNTVPFLVRTRGHTWASLIRETHAWSMSVLAFQHVPLKSIQKWCSRGRPLFDNLFTFQVEQPQPGPWTLEDGPSRPDYALALEATQTRGGMRVSLVARNAATVEVMLNLFEHEVETARACAAVEGEHGAADEEADEVLLDTSDGHVEGSAEYREHRSDLHGSMASWTDQGLLIREEMTALSGVPADKVTPTTTMQELGLDSIDTMKLSARLRRKGVNLSTSQILRCQSISRMAQDLDGHHRFPTQHADPLRELKPRLYAQLEKSGLDLGDVESVLPPTALQEAMVTGMEQSGYQWYFGHDVLEVAAWVDLERLAEAWERLVELSPILRTGFVEVDDTNLDMAYCQVVLRDAGVQIRTVTLSHISDVWQMTADATRRAVEGRGLRDLVQFAFVVVGEQRYALLSMAHALYDGWSLRLLRQDLEAAYGGRVEARPSAEPFVAQALASATAEARDFWAGYLGGLDPSLLGKNRASGSSQRLEISSSKSLAEVRRFCREKAISLQTLCAAAWAMVVAGQVGALDVAFGAVLSGRDGEGAESLLFPTMNTVTVRCVLHGSVSGFLQYLEQSLADVCSFQAFPLRKAHAAAKLDGVFDTLFLMQRGREEKAEMLRSVDGESAVEYPVCIEAEPGQGLTWRIACQSFSAEEAELLVKKTDRALAFMLEHEAADVLSFEGEDVSICGVPVSVRDRADRNTATTALDEDGREDERCDETELAVRNALGQVSQVPVESITPGSRLHQLGLDSISAIKVSMLLRKGGIWLTPRELKLCSVREMAKAARKGPEQASPAAWEPPRDMDTSLLLRERGLESVERLLPATAMQVHMLTAWQNAAEAVFFAEFCHRIGAAQAARVDAAWARLTGEVPILRTLFVATGSERLPWLQVVVGKDDMRTGRVSQPLARVSVTQGTLRLRIHHALYDGFSLPAIVSRLYELLDGAAGQAQELSGWARYCVAPCLPEARERRREFWTGYLADASGRGISWGDDASANARLCLDVSGPTERTCHVDASAADATRLRATASQQGISLQSLFLAGLATCLGRRSGHGEGAMILGIYLANRTGDLSAFYPTLCLVPLKVRLRRDGDLVALAREVQRDMDSVSSDGRAEVGLLEIRDCTGINVDSFVNFLPEGSGGDLTLAAEDASGPLGQEPLLEQPWVRRNAVREAFLVSHRQDSTGLLEKMKADMSRQPSVDVEASVQGGKLAMGVFGPRARVSEQWAAGLVADTAALLVR